MEEYAKEVTDGAEQEQAELLTASELARKLGVAASTILNWRRRHDNPLRAVTLPNGALRFTWIQFDEFSRANPHLRAVAKYKQRARGHEPSPPPQTTAGPTQIEELKSIARDLRNAADAHLQAALESARLAEETAHSHRVQLEQIARAFAAYDAALTNITAPSTIND